ncbi:uncharacterized protein LOC62_06G007868 [Vanrija pseudolonga]|uniref:Uncharacterized protein n=1 Tax=Vanrija pseudolonga TaxID=143232 RepID=A0AAF0YCS2_9TREE|nr:hypothetical protein LOC62_06G007868 [Vanrija pseudolonga]
MRLAILALTFALFGSSALAAPAKLPLAAHAFAASRDGIYAAPQQDAFHSAGSNALSLDIDRSLRSCRLVTLTMEGGVRPYTLSIGRDHGRSGIDWLLEADDVGWEFDWTVEADRGWSVIVQVTDALGDVVKRTFPVLPGSTACLRRV